MCLITVIIPYFQRKPGILRRALNSILSQELPPNVDVNVIVVDDGSPVPAKDEAEGLIFIPPFDLKIFVQTNGGVAAARNAGLRYVSAHTDLIAFLDSDDSWNPKHLWYALHAFEDGCDFYFTDNRRIGQHESYFIKICPKILELSSKRSEQYKIRHIHTQDLVPIIIKHFPTQASSVVYRRGAFQDYLFPEFQKFAGEDLIFFTQVAKAAKRIYFCSEAMVECGDGENMYFGNIHWGSPKLLSIISDQIQMLLYMRQTIAFTDDEDRLAQLCLAYYRKKFVFHAIRYFIKNKGRFPSEISALSQRDRSLSQWFTKYALLVSTGTMLGLYKPS